MNQFAKNDLFLIDLRRGQRFLAQKLCNIFKHESAPSLSIMPVHSDICKGLFHRLHYDYRARKVFIKISCSRMPEKREMDSFRLYALAFHNPDLLFCQPVKLVDQGVYLSICGFYLTLERGLLVGGAAFLVHSLKSCSIPPFLSASFPGHIARLARLRRFGGREKDAECKCTMVRCSF